VRKLYSPPTSETC